MMCRVLVRCTLRMMCTVLEYWYNSQCHMGPARSAIGTSCVNRPHYHDNGTSSTQVVSRKGCSRRPYTVSGWACRLSPADSNPTVSTLYECTYGEIQLLHRWVGELRWTSDANECEQGSFFTNGRPVLASAVGREQSRDGDCMRQPGSSRGLARSGLGKLHKQLNSSALRRTCRWV